MAETTTLTLSEFLLARIAEDEAALDRLPVLDHALPKIFVTDPERRLAECAAKRRVVELHAPLDGGAPESYPFTSEFTGKLIYPECGECGHGSEPYCPTLRLLALPYAEHPDYRAEWRPRA